jgi:riboflavin kinase/FMN adenylyltransferase
MFENAFEKTEERAGASLKSFGEGALFVPFSEKAQAGLPPGALLALGCFDGIHEGHRSLLESAAAFARARGLAFGVWSPKGAKNTGTLLPFEDKMARLKDLSADFYLEEDFLAIKDLSGETFFWEHLVKGYGVGALACGENFTFGKGGKEGVTELQSYADAAGIPLLVERLKSRGETPYSSALVRAALQRGECREAELLLGAPYGFSGRVIRGRQVGRGLGFPTANVELPPNSPLRMGVYGVAVTVDGKRYPALANVGVHPTFERASSPLCEAYLLEDPKEALYGKRVSLSFLCFFREERKFSAPEELVLQIGRDLALARDFFARMAEERGDFFRQ